MDKISVVANNKELGTILNFMKEKLDSFEVSQKSILQLELSIEEAFINIVKYGFESNIENKEIDFGINVKQNPLIITVKFFDNGVKFNPLELDDPDISNSENREVGGLGIFLIKKNVDNIYYSYEDGRNILTLKKLLE
jgi:anti-sigma regulatory factor (Ser/Thr protein kinase)